MLRIFYENSCTIPTIKIFFLPCKAMKRMKYEKLLIQWTMHPHVTSEICRLEYLIFIYIHDLLRFFLWKFLYFSYHKIFPSTLQSYELLNEVWKTTADILQSDYLLLDFCDFAKKKMANCFIRLRLKFSQEYYNDTFITIHDAVWIVCMLYDVGYIFFISLSHWIIWNHTCYRPA